MKDPQSLQDLMTARIAEFCTSSKPAELIDKYIEKMFAEVAEQAFRSYGPMGRAVNAAIEDALPANLSTIAELTKYNTLVANTLRAKWESCGVEGELVRRATEAMDEVLAKDAVPAEVSLRQLIDLFVEEHKEEAIEDRWERPTVRFDEDHAEFLYVYFDKQPEDEGTGRYSSRKRPNHELDYMLAIHKDDTRCPKSLHERGGVFGARLNGASIGKTFSIRTELDRMIAGIYFGNAKVLIDCDADDFSYDIYR